MTEILAEVRVRPCAFITCAARATSSVEPLLDAAERALMELGWRTRLPRRSEPHDPTPAEERRRLRLAAYRDIQRADVIIHVPGPSRISGQRLHHELAQAVKAQVPVLLLLARAFRADRGIPFPSDERMASLVDMTAGAVIEELHHLSAAIEQARGDSR